MPKDRPDPEPEVVKHFDILYAEYDLLRPWLLKMGIKANRLPERDYLGPILYRFTLKRLELTHHIIEKFKKTVFTEWMRIRNENKEEVWNYYIMMSPDLDHLAEVVALKEQSRVCTEFWFSDENNVFVKDKKRAKDDKDGNGEEDTANDGGVGRTHQEDQEAGTEDN